MEADKATILVVDDEPAYLDAYTRWLEREGYTVRTATTGEEALDQYDDEVDLVLLDRLMPGYSGDDVLEDLQERSHDLAIIVVTGVDPDIDVADLRFNEYLVKPVDHETLVETVDRVLQLSDRDALIQEYASLLDTKFALESRVDPATLKDHDEYRELQERLKEVRNQIDPVDERIAHRLAQKWPDADDLFDSPRRRDEN